MGELDDPVMLAQDLAFSCDYDPIRVYPKADRAVGERCRHAVAVALKVYEAGRRHPFGMFDESVEGTAQGRDCQ